VISARCPPTTKVTDILMAKFTISMIIPEDHRTPYGKNSHKNYLESFHDRPSYHFEVLVENGHQNNCVNN
jgi:hypothetical protein